MTKKIAVVAGIIFAALIVWIMYQHLVVVPQNKIDAQAEQARLNRIADVMEIADQERKYDNCISSAYNVYSMGWDNQCELEGKEADCSLSAYQYKVIEERHETAQAACLTRFK